METHLEFMSNLLSVGLIKSAGKVATRLDPEHQNFQPSEMNVSRSEQMSSLMSNHRHGN